MHRLRLNARRLRATARAVGVETDGAIAERAGVGASTLSRLLAGRTTPSTETLVALADTYRIPMDDLVQRVGRRPNVPALNPKVPAQADRTSV
ncbi:helix-turn-helix domain-containing protein [Streptomyces sp. AD55]|uniref:helix-turn-helix domain-containing protein n=1 Tax=Streptomyces sp. AD55 TaxID=3242895 RepID=UPI003527EE4F